MQRSPSETDGLDLPKSPRPGQSVFRIAVEQFDRNALGSTQKTDAHARTYRRGLAGEFDTFLLEIGGNRIDPAHREAKMIEAAIGRNRRDIDAVAGRNRRDEN